MRSYFLSLSPFRSRPRIEREEEHKEMEKERDKNKFYVSGINPEDFKERKHLYEEMIIVKRQVGLIAREQELLKIHQKDLLEIMTELLNMVETEEQRNEKVPLEVTEQVEDEDKEPIEKTIEDQKRERLQKTSLFKAPDHRLR